MKILILGGDGYLGWPTSMHFANQNHQVVIVDNCIRRSYDHELNTDSLNKISSIHEKIKKFAEITKKTIGFFHADITNFPVISKIIKDFQPDVIIHFAEQRSAPYSMIDIDHSVHTQVNNIVGTLNILYAIKQFHPKCHLIKLGTMGEYGTPNIDIEEGFIEINHKGRTDTLPFPMQPSSFYHLSKLHDSNNIFFACKAWKLSVTDLHQGVVYGSITKETSLSPELNTRFDYDEVFGTVLNRFCLQASLNIPLTVYGKGTQKRTFLNINDTLKCIELAALNPPAKGVYRVLNQFSESFSILDLAQKVIKASKKLKLNSKLELIKNPRFEKEDHYYNPSNKGLVDLGFNPIKLNETIINDLLLFCLKYNKHAIIDRIKPGITWM